MTEKTKILEFLVKARLNTYAGKSGNVQPVITDSKQLEYVDGGWLYRDIYYTGAHTFNGVETIYYNDKAVFSLSYYGNWGSMTENEIDNILRPALSSNPNTRCDKQIIWHKDNYQYNCMPRPTDDDKELCGEEIILQDGAEIYKFSYMGSILVKNFS